MNIIFLVVQSLLGLFFLFGGVRFTFQSIATLAENKNFTFVRDIPVSLMRFNGVVEILAGLALLVPTFTGLLRWSTPLAALGIALLMLCAGTFHIRRREYNVLPLNATLFVVALFVVFARWSWLVA
jgi:putative oxidoreductase